LRLTIPFLLPNAALNDEPRPTWAALKQGVSEGWISRANVVAHAVHLLERDLQASDDVVLLAGLTQDELLDVDELLDRLAVGEEAPADSDYWRRRALRWLYEHRDEVDDPLGVVEEIYAHFGYPEDMASFVRYMPPTSWRRTRRSSLGPGRGSTR
jgi:hypothetical protein